MASKTNESRFVGTNRNNLQMEFRPLARHVRRKRVSDFPEAVAQWCENCGLDPSRVFAVSQKKVTWKCETGHTFVRSPRNHIRKDNKLRPCPDCVIAKSTGIAGKSVRDIPLLSEEWDESKNGSSANVSAGSNKKASWRCEAGHEFSKSPNGRTNNGRQTGRVAPCPLCYEATITRWTWEIIVAKARPVVENQGFLPPAQWFLENRMASLVQALYTLGYTWDALRDAFGSYENSGFVSSRNGMRWRSHPEASLSNFLYARGIKHERGRKYPDSYAEASGLSYGYYDLHFLALGSWIDVEIWGDKPNGHAESIYAEKRKAKERFQDSRPDFLGVEFRDCYAEDRLEAILEPFIGKIKPFVFDKPTDSIIQSTHWSNADELIVECARIAAMQPGGIFPSEEWLRKRGKFSTRDGPAYNTMAVYIKTWLGGIRTLRVILGQASASTKVWSKEAALSELGDWWKKYGRSPQAVAALAHRGRLIVSKEELARGIRIAGAVQKYAGGTIIACNLLGIKPSRRYR